MSSDQPHEPHEDLDTERGRRKDEHLSLALSQRAGAQPRSAFDDVEFLHHALDGIDETAVDLSTQVGPARWPLPLYVNGMTGGTATTAALNRELAITARETGLPIGTGSMSIALDDPSTAEGFRVLRSENPDGFVMANLGAGRSADDARRAVDLIAADALQLHVNAVQETVMPEGRRDFSRWSRSIEQIVAASPVPVVVKEVGFGLSGRTQLRLRELGVQIADVSGAGGTDFVRIENSRRERPDYAHLEGFGQSAVECLLDATTDLSLLASGGVRSPLDVIRALALGARAVGVAGGFAQVASEGGAEALIPHVHRWCEQLRQLHALLGAAGPAELVHTDLLLRGRVQEFCTLRGLDAGAMSRRRERSRPIPEGEPHVR